MASLATRTSRRPLSRDDFEVAIICALPLEYDAVAILLDERWDDRGEMFGRAPGDSNTYTTGRMGEHNVVVLVLSDMGKVNAATTACYLKLSYQALTLVLLVGICGGVPLCAEGEILLGDVIISKTLVQHDLGKQYPNELLRKDTYQDNLRKHNRNILNFLALFSADSNKIALQECTANFLTQLQSRSSNQTKYKYPGTSRDKLFQPGYRHKHHESPTCICKNCNERQDAVCDATLHLSCDELGCHDTYLESRQRLLVKSRLEREGKASAQDPNIYSGAIASGDQVIKSGEHRDMLSQKERVIAFEMEAAGVWDELPCIVIKGVSDYADSHKNDEWQNFAAATAASTSKTLLRRYPRTDRRSTPLDHEHFAGVPNHRRRLSATDDDIAASSRRHANGVSLFRQKNYSQAETEIRWAAECRKRLLGPDHKATYDSIHWLGVILHHQKEYLLASKQLQCAANNRERLFDINSEDTLTSIQWLGCNHYYLKEYDKARQELQRAADGRRRILGIDNEDTLSSLYWLGIVFYDQKNFSQAERMFRCAAREQESLLGHYNEDALCSVHWLGVTLYKQGRYAEAEDELKCVADARQWVLGLDDEDTLLSQFWLGCCFYGQKKYTHAEDTFKQLRDSLRKVCGHRHAKTLEAAEWLTKAREKRG
ncbi:hypothetical protein QQS21_007706 [Conoideocrella luteorostrata]|uniref:Nucleoside phosphorylase domain-containing protein n=1 Tax=Conoideocrella luteorostrata TaxID=1105319 RepID=A0AAJ0CPK0_9HYPO|nr:hypothetical protein QQS21_007706 [Conoideocrella luteorostrata]